ncbi:MAG: CCA tRNA nucleotidyltransferase [Candidatus Izemoplasma sp.]
MNRYFEIGKEILNKLNGANYSAYFVGGYIRDRILEIESHDIDITTSATVKEITSLFDNVKNTGEKYGSVTVIIDEFKFEVTTYRFDGTYLDNRRPEGVVFTKNLEDDLERRDFTINALCMDSSEKIIDLHNGINDLNNKLIKTINDPLKRFNEDALRILRAFRFVSKLGFDIEDKTKAGIKSTAHLIKTISIERVMIELSKILIAPYRNKALKLMNELGILDELYGLKDGLVYLSNSEDELYAIEAFTLCFILNDIDDVWRFSNKEIRLIRQLIMITEATKEADITQLMVYSNGVDACLIANKINVTLGRKDQVVLIKKIDSLLPIKDVCDLKFKGQDILWLTNMQKKSDIGLIIDDLIFKVINNILPNDYEILKKYTLMKIDDLEKDDNNE